VLIVSGIHLMPASGETLLPKASTAVVTLDVFSGRPNPTWALSEQRTAELLHRLQALEPTKVETPEFDGLGYRAVRVELQQPGNGAAVVTAARGLVTLDRADERVRYTDAGRQFELWLVNTGSDQLPPDLLRYVTGEIASKPR